MFCDLNMCRNNWEVYFFHFCKGIIKLILTLLVHWNVGKYSDYVIMHLNLLFCWNETKLINFQNNHKFSVNSV